MNSEHRWAHTVKEEQKKKVDYPITHIDTMGILGSFSTATCNTVYLLFHTKNLLLNLSVGWNLLYAYIVYVFYESNRKK